MSKNKIGLITPFWPPLFGGAEQYEYRLASELSERGWDVHVFCGTPGQEDSRLKVTRWLSDKIFTQMHWSNFFKSHNHGNLSRLMEHYEFFSSAVKWCESNDLKLILIGNRLQHTGIFHARELYLQLKKLKCKVGLIHHDSNPAIEKTLVDLYKKNEHDWPAIGDILVNRIRSISKNLSEIEFNYKIGSPLFFDPDFVISNSEWSDKFIDPFNRVPRQVLHPILDVTFLRSDATQKLNERRNILMINPQGRKNPEAMGDLINDDALNLTFRVLKGGWGNSFKTFLPSIEPSRAFRERRLEVIERVDSMEHAYRLSDLVFFPSFIEGYGMAAVEPMLFGTPVVSSNYPAITEGVGNAACLFCPYKSSVSERKSKVLEVLHERSKWSELASSRANFLLKRQEEELHKLEDFLLSRQHA